MIRNSRWLVASVLLASCSSSPPSTSTCTKDTECNGGRCLSSACYPKTCAQKTCGSVEVCVTDRCVDERCVGLTCPAGNICARGACLDTSCNGAQCPDGQVCSMNVCTDASCVGVTCPSGATCQGGACADPCANVSCSAGQVCRGGACVDACTNVTCTGGLVCQGGQCVSPCANVTCGQGLVCQAGQCVDACTNVTCNPGQVCRVGQCVDACTTITCDPGKTCQAGVCIDTACVSVTCTGGKVCSMGTCLEPACVGKTCSGANEVCSAGTCVDRCTLVCGGTCPQCANGRACTANPECQSHLCETLACTACDTVHTCPNGATCSNGICRQGVGGPCAATTDCNLGLTCEDNLCKLPAGQQCTGPNQCVKAVVCENLVCQKPHCQLQLIESQPVPGYVTSWASIATGFNPTTGELYVSQGQWDNNYANSAIRRYRVSPGVAAVEQAPTTAPLISLPSNQPIPQGFSDDGASVASNWFASLKQFWWVAGGGPWDGRVAVRIEFSGFNNDIGANFSNSGRFAKCGRDFYFFANALGGTRAMLRFTAPVDVNTSAQTMQIDLTTSTARRDTWALPVMFDMDCAPDSLWALGASSGVVTLQKLDRNSLATMGTALSLPGVSAGNSSVGDDDLTRVSDDHFYVRDQGSAIWQVYQGRIERLTPGAGIGGAIFGTRDGIVVYQSTVVRRYEKRMQNGSVPPLDATCVWQ